MKVGEVEVHLEGDGPETIVMVHGWPDTHRLWDGTVAALKDRYRCARFTLPGYDAAHALRARTLDEIVETIEEVADAVSPQQKVILLLHDWGCVFGYEYYTRNPGRVSRVVGVDIGDPSSLAKSLSFGAAMGTLFYQVFLAVAWIVGGAVGDRMTRWMARRMRCPADPAAIGCRMNYPYYMLWFGGAQSYRRHSHGFRPQVPTLFLYGRRKPFMFHAESWLEHLRRLPGSAAVEFDTGHWVMIQQPARFNDVVARWLAGGSVPSLS